MCVAQNNTVLLCSRTAHILKIIQYGHELCWLLEDRKGILHFKVVALLYVPYWEEMEQICVIL
jgi:hypothetical protein